MLPVLIAYCSFEFLAYFDFTYYWYVLYILLSDVILLLLCYLCNY